MYIEETDFQETDPDLLPKGSGRPGDKREKFFGMAPGKECVLKYASQILSPVLVMLTESARQLGRLCHNKLLV